MIVQKNDRPHRCTYCTKSFRLSQHLKEHVRIHTGEKPYKCHICGHAFCQISNLKSHRATHTKIKSYGCKECGKKFRRSFTLKQHSRVHDKTKQKTSRSNFPSHSHAQISKLDTLLNNIGVEVTPTRKQSIKKRVITLKDNRKKPRCNHLTSKKADAKNHLSKKTLACCQDFISTSPPEGLKTFPAGFDQTLASDFSTNAAMWRNSLLSTAKLNRGCSLAHPERPELLWPRLIQSIHEATRYTREFPYIYNSAYRTDPTVWKSNQSSFMACDNLQKLNVSPIIDRFKSANTNTQTLQAISPPYQDSQKRKQDSAEDHYKEKQEHRFHYKNQPFRPTLKNHLAVPTQSGVSDLYKNLLKESGGLKRSKQKRTRLSSLSDGESIVSPSSSSSILHNVSFNKQRCNFVHNHPKTVIQDETKLHPGNKAKQPAFVETQTLGVGLPVIGFNAEKNKTINARNNTKNLESRNHNVWTEQTLPAQLSKSNPLDPCYSLPNFALSHHTSLTPMIAWTPVVTGWYSTADGRMYPALVDQAHSTRFC